jgi:hypothetical protein
MQGRRIGSQNQQRTTDMQTNDADRLAILRQIIDYSIENGESLATFRSRAESILRDFDQPRRGLLEQALELQRAAPARRAAVEAEAQRRLSQASSQESPEASSEVAGAAAAPSQPQACAKGGVVCQPANHPWPARLQAWLAGLRDQARRYVKGS